MPGFLGCSFGALRLCLKVKFLNLVVAGNLRVVGAVKLRKSSECPLLFVSQDVAVGLREMLVYQGEIRY